MAAAESKDAIDVLCRDSVTDVSSDQVASGGLSLRRNFSWTLAGNMVYTASQWAMLVVFAKMGSPEAVGRFAVGLAVTAPIIMFANLQLRTVLATDSTGQLRYGEYFALRIVTAALAMLAITVFAFAFGYNIEVAMVILAVGAAKVLESLSDICYGAMQLHDRMDRWAISLFLRGPLALLALGVLFAITGSVMWGALGLAAAWALVLIQYDLRAASKTLGTAREALHGEQCGAQGCASLRPIWNPRRLVNLVVMSLPLGFAMMLISLNTNVPRYFLVRYLGERELGLYAAMTYLMVAGTTVVSAMALSAVSRLARYYSSGNGRAFSRLLIKLSGFGAAVGVLGVLVATFAGKWLLNLLYGPEYAEHSSVLVWIAFGSAVALVQWFLSHGMMAAKRYRVQVPIYGSVTVIVAVGCFVLIPRYGLLGAALAVLAAELFQAVVTLLVNLRAVSSLSRQAETDNK